MIQAAAADSAASAALWAPEDLCSQCCLAACSFTTPYLFYSALFFCMSLSPSQSAHLLVLVLLTRCRRLSLSEA